MKVGFLNNQIDNRGTGNALFDYAHYNEEILGNQSVIFTLDHSARDLSMETRLLKRFGNIYKYDGTDHGVNVLYHIKSGEYDGYDKLVNSERTKYVVHTVFNGSQPHGHAYAAISQWLGNTFNIPFVPHIAHLPETEATLHERLSIPRNSVVFGRYGGRDTFDISFAWRSINRALEKRKNLYFLFMNTDIPNVTFMDINRIIFLEPVATPLEKRAFINTCDAMVHARQRGETFGISTAEFAICGKPVLTYAHSGERAHIEYLRAQALLYEDEYILEEHLTSKYFKFIPKQDSLYYECTPQKVMKKFREVFLN